MIACATTEEPFGGAPMSGIATVLPMGCGVRTREHQCTLLRTISAIREGPGATEGRTTWDASTGRSRTTLHVVTSTMERESTFSLTCGVSTKLMSRDGLLAAMESITQTVLIRNELRWNALPKVTQPQSQFGATAVAIGYAMMTLTIFVSLPKQGAPSTKARCVTK